MKILYDKFSTIILSGLLIMAVALIFPACEVIEPEPEIDHPDLEEEASEVNDLKEESEEAIGEILLMLPPTAGNLTASPDGDFLLFTMAAAPIEPYHIINIETYEGKIHDDWGIYWGEIEYLTTPGLEVAQIEAPHFSPDSKKLLYVGYEVDNYEYVNAVIYIFNAGLPPEAEYQIELSGDEFIRGIRPAWKADQQGIYYLTAKGVMSYCPEKQQAEKLYSAEALSGLVEDENLAPHSFLVKDDFAGLAYFYEGEIEIVPLKNDHFERERFDTELMEISSIEFIFDGRYLALGSDLMYDTGHWLKFFDLETGEMVELESNYLPAGYVVNDRQEMAFIKYNQAGDFEIAILDESLEEVKTAGLPRLTENVILLDSAWCVLGSNQDGYPLYKVDFR